MKRRHFLKLSGTAAALPALGLPTFGRPDLQNQVPAVLADLTGDGLNLSPEAYTALLAKLTANQGLKEDYYSQNGIVALLEQKFVQMLGKEAAVFMPTGTLANHLAIRALAGEAKRVIVQQESHVYNDTGDGTQILSNLNLIPLAQGKAGFTLEEVTEVVKRTASGRVAAKLGVISIESPVRRKTGEVFDFAEMKRIAQFARENNIKMHLDGARMFLAAPYTGVTPIEYASLFDTVYVSLYKYFNAASGAILAGPKELIGPMFHTRRMFGSGLHQAWPFAAVANYYVDGFPDRFAKAVDISKSFLRKLKSNNRFAVHEIGSGTNITRVSVKNASAKTFVELLGQKGVIVRTGADPDEILLTFNESLLHTTAVDLEKIFISCLP